MLTDPPKQQTPHIPAVSDDELGMMRAQVMICTTQARMWIQELYTFCKWLDEEDPYKILVKRACDASYAAHKVAAKRYQAALVRNGDA